MTYIQTVFCLVSASYKNIFTACASQALGSFYYGSIYGPLFYWQVDALVVSGSNLLVLLTAFYLYHWFLTTVINFLIYGGLCSARVCFICAFLHDLFRQPFGLFLFLSSFVFTEGHGYYYY